MSALLFMPTDIPLEPTETQKKVAAADAAQATATTAQGVADEYRKVAEDAVAADHPEADPLAETTKINVRELAKEGLDAAIRLLRKINTPKE